MTKRTKNLLMLVGAAAAAYWLLRRKSAKIEGMGALSPDSYAEEKSDCQSRNGTLKFPACPGGMICDSMPDGCSFSGGQVKYSRVRPYEKHCQYGWWEQHPCGPSFPGKCVSPADNQEYFTSEDCNALSANIPVPLQCEAGMEWSVDAGTCRQKSGTLIVTPIQTPGGYKIASTARGRAWITSLIWRKPLGYAQALLRQKGVSYRVESRDGMNKMLTKDLNMARAGLTINGGIVTRVTWG